MVNRCVAYGCKSAAKKGSGIQFHRFPIRNNELLKKWIKNVRRKNWLPTKHSTLCSSHFKADDYKCRPNANIRLLKEDAVPTIFNFPSHLQKKCKDRQNALRIYASENMNDSASRKNVEVVCCVPFCTSRKGKEGPNGQFLSFHGLPSDYIRRSQWEEEIFRHTLVPVLIKKVAYVCSLHFIENDYVQLDKRRILKDTAVPSVFRALPGISPSGYLISNTEQLTPSVNIETKYCIPDVVLKRSTLSEVLENNLYCRLCGKVDEDCMPIFEAEGKEMELNKKIPKYLPINVSESDNLPNRICPSCVSAVNAWHEYAESCLTAEIKLQEIFPAQELKISDLKAENCEVVTLMPDNLSTENQELSNNQDVLNITINGVGPNVVKDVEASDNNINEDDASNIVVNEYNDSLQSYQHERQICSSVAYNPNLCLLILNNSQNLETHVRNKPQNADIHMLQNIETVEPNTETHQPKVRIYDLNKPRKPNSSKLKEHEIYQNKCAKTLMGRKDKEYQESEKHAGENIFICDVCGKGFLSKIILEKHTSIHSTSLNFVCQYCNGKFNTRYSRNNHQRNCPYKTDTNSLDG